MKPIVFNVFLISLTLLACTGISTPGSIESKGEWIELELTQGLGYFTKTEGVNLLEKIKMSEMKDKGWEIIKENDTIGKYIQSKETGHYIICLIDVQSRFDFETHVLVELEAIGVKTYRVVAKERYVHGNYACCWSNYCNGFNQKDGFFTFNCCATGSGFCGSKSYWFKRVLPQDSLRSIPTEYSSTDGDTTLELTSKNTVKNDVLTVNYRLVNYRREKKDLLLSVVDSFTINYTFKDNTWWCFDKNLERLDF